MSEAKFTKGKWFIEKDANWNNDCWAISVKRDHNDSVHHCFAEVVYKMENEESNPELEANAHLIAAAPEMYEILSEINYQLGSVYGDRINELLAKARGEQND